MTRAARIGVLCAVTAAAVPARGAPELHDAILPAGVVAGWLLRVDLLPEPMRAQPLRYDVSPAGRPLVQAGDRFLLLADRGAPLGVPFRIFGASAVDDFAFMQDGALLLTAGDRLGIVSATGFKPLSVLPSSGMRVAAAGADRAYLWGGAGAQRENLYLYRKGGGVVHLLRAPSPITAVAGDGDVTFFAVGTSVMRLEGGRPPSLVKEMAEAVTSLALASPTRVFYSTASGAGYLDAGGSDYPFVRGSGAEVRVQGDTLYFLFAREGLLRVAPVSAFGDMAAAIDGAAVR